MATISENNDHISKDESALYTNLIEALSILAPLDTPGEPNTLIDLCRKAMSPIRIAVSSLDDLRLVLPIIAEAGYKVWIETVNSRNSLGAHITLTYICFDRKP